MQKMLQDQNFSVSFEAWCNMDRQLPTQFIEDLFIVDPTCTTYSQILQQACMYAFLAHADKSQYGHSFRSNVSTPGSRQESSSSNSSSHKYNPYNKDNDHGRSSDSFWEGHKLTLCLQCGAIGHRAGKCSATKSNCSYRPINCEWKNNQLMSRNDKTICVMFNI